MSDRTCELPDCERPHRARGYCHTHYVAARANGMKTMQQNLHVLSDIRPDVRLATCSVCGPDSKIYSAGRVSPRFNCATKVKQWRESWLARPENLEKHREYHREYHRRYKFGFSRAEIDAILNRPDLACEICSKGLTRNQARLDHDHACCPRGAGCGKCFRGVLCNGCNSAIGLLQESEVLFAKAIEYLGLDMKIMRESA